MKKDELIKEINELDAKRKPLEEKVQKIKNAEIAVYKKSLVGKCFTYRRNCYSCPKTSSDYWDEFYRIQRVGKYGVVALSVCKDSEKQIRMNEQELSVYSTDRTPNDLTPITEKEFNKHFDALLREMKKE
jgi:hypothetical protein